METLVSSKDAAATLAALATIFGVLVAIATLIKAIHEYRRSNALRRVETYRQIAAGIYDNPVLMNVARNLDSSAIKHLSVHDKVRFLVFYEQIALMYNSSLISLPVAEYLFGYYIIKAYDTEDFWNDFLRKNDPYWAVLTRFVNLLREQRARRERSPETETPRLRF